MSRRVEFDVVTIFPELIEAWAEVGMVGIARSQGLVTVQAVNPREFTTDRHRSVDDRPYGGGPGMVMTCDPLFRAVESLGLEPARRAPDETLLVMTPQGEPFTQQTARELSGLGRIGIVCGRYEGIDERVIEGLGAREISIGDYVLSGGEIAAMVVAEATARLIPGVLGDPESLVDESFEDGTLDYPQYTRPEVYREMPVPEVLLSGHHEKIRQWRDEQARKRTARRRRDLLEDPPGSDGTRHDNG